MSDKRIGRFGQIKIYVGKCFRSFIYEKGWISLLTTVIVAVILSWVIGDNTFKTFEDTRSGAFAMICGCIWTGLFNSIQSICRERQIIKREHRTGLHLSSYITAHMIYEFVLCVAESIILTVIFALFRNFPDNGVLFGWTAFEIFISFTLVIFCADTLGILISCIVKTQNAAMIVMPFVLIFQLVMAGMMFKIPSEAEYVKELTISKWGLNAVCSTSDVTKLPTSREFAMQAEGNNTQIPLTQAELKAMEEYKADYKATAKNLGNCWGVLAGYSMVYGFLGTLFLKLVDKDKR
ncbi:MAG: ABC transporter permease [Clostridia bacterium]|nr:ABC transporter permease [Clostridia bacterium]